MFPKNDVELILANGGFHQDSVEVFTLTAIIRNNTNKDLIFYNVNNLYLVPKCYQNVPHNELIIDMHSPFELMLYTKKEKLMTSNRITMSCPVEQNVTVVKAKSTTFFEIEVPWHQERITKRKYKIQLLYDGTPNPDTSIDTLENHKKKYKAEIFSGILKSDLIVSYNVKPYKHKSENIYIHGKRRTPR